MAGRIRSLKPEWLDDERLAECSDGARMLSVSLILLADDYGRGRAGTAYLAGQVWAAHDGGKRRAAEALAELVAIRYVRVYEVEGQSYYEIRTWTKHQRVDNAGKPRVPEPLTDIAEIRGEIPRTAETRGDSPPDLRPPIPTSDPDLRPPTEESPEPQAALVPAPPPILVFPVVGDPNRPTWDLTPALVRGLSVAFPGLDVLAECRGALAWVEASPRNRKTAGGMRKFLTGWCQRSVNRGGQRAGPRSLGEVRMEANLAAAEEGWRLTR